MSASESARHCRGTLQPFRVLASQVSHRAADCFKVKRLAKAFLKGVLSRFEFNAGYKRRLGGYSCRHSIQL